MSFRDVLRLTTRHFGSYDALIEAFLAEGCRLFDLETGIASRIDGDRYIVEAVQSPLGIAQGDVFELAGTYCAAVHRERRTIAWPRVGAMEEMQGHPVYVGLQLEAYISTPIWVFGRLYGTLNWTSQTARASFDEEEIELVEAMGEATGRFLEQRALGRERDAMERQLSAVFEHAPVGIVIRDLEGIVVNANPTLARMCSRVPTEIIGRPVTELVAHPERVGNLLQMTRGGADAVVETALLRPDASTLPVEVSVVSFELDGRPVAMGLVRDVSARKEVERSKTEFVSVVSHEIRTPLTAIRGSMDLVANGIAGPVPDKAGVLLRMAVRNATRLGRLIDDLLDLNRLDLNRIELHTEDVELEAVCVEVAATFPEGDHTILVNGDGVVVRGDRDRIAQVVTNLVGNALKYATGEVRVRVLAEDRHARVHVEDDGPGIPPEMLGAVFDKFKQLGGEAGGVGLGLAISKSLVETMGGEMGVVSKVGVGSTFWFTLPRA